MNKANKMKVAIKQTKIVTEAFLHFKTSKEANIFLHASRKNACGFSHRMNFDR